MHFAEIGRFLIAAGAVVLLVGLVFFFADKLPLGRLPGDLRFGSGNFRVYFPWVTCILLSLMVTLLVNFLSGK